VASTLCARGRSRGSASARPRGHRSSRPAWAGVGRPAMQRDLSYVVLNLANHADRGKQYQSKERGKFVHSRPMDIKILWQPLATPCL
jgi:hypothetical protein